jgi:hypothetical protein
LTVYIGIVVNNNLPSVKLPKLTKNLSRREILSLIGVVIVLLAIPLTVILFRRYQDSRIKAFENAEIVAGTVKITNIHAHGFTVSWATKGPSTGAVRWGPTGQALVQMARDDRGPDTVSSTHHVTLPYPPGSDETNSFFETPEQTFDLKILSGDGKLYGGTFDNIFNVVDVSPTAAPVRVTTGPELSTGLPDGSLSAVKLTSDQNIVAINNTNRTGDPAQTFTYTSAKNTGKNIFLPLFAKNASLDPFKGFGSTLQIQNTTDQPANVTLHFYPLSNGTEAGNPNDPSQKFTIPARGFRQRWWKDDLPALPDGFLGSVVVESDQNITAVASTKNENGNWETGGDGGFVSSEAAQTYHLPFFAKNYEGYNSNIHIQNTGSVRTFVTVQFYNADGEAYGFLGDWVPPKSCLIIAAAPLMPPDPVPDNFLGSVLIQSHNDIDYPGSVNGENIVASVFSTNLDPELSFAYRGFSPTVAGNDQFSPLFAKGFHDHFSTLYLHNIDLTRTAPIIARFYDAEGVLQGTVRQTIPTGGLIEVDAMDIAEIPVGFLGSVIIESDGGNFAAVTKTTRITNLETGGFETLSPGGDTGTTLYFPVYANNFHDQISSIQVQNTADGDTANVCFYAYDAEGQEVYSECAAVAPFSFHQFYAPSLNQCPELSPCGGQEWEGSCWYEGAEGESCATVCAAHGGNAGTCQENDNSSCDLCHLFHPGGGCIGVNETYDPIYFPYFNRCDYRASPTEGNCSTYNPGGRRFCACAASLTPPTDCSDPIYGEVQKSSGVVAPGTIVYITVKNSEGTSSAPLSAVANGDGRYVIDLGNARASGFGDYFAYDRDSTTYFEDVSAQGGVDGTTELLNNPTNNDEPIPTLILNHPPVITPIDDHTATEGVAYSYQVVASDADGDALTYGLNGSPEGMVINQSGLISWPNPTPVGASHKISVRVSDGKSGGLVTEDYNLTVVEGADTTPPAAVTNLTVTEETTNSITLTWTAPGDDGNTGTASQYDVRYSDVPITAANWGDVSQAPFEPTPQPAGATETFTIHTLTSGMTYYFAFKTADEVPNWSGLSNVAVGTTRTNLVCPFPKTFDIAPGEVQDLTATPTGGSGNYNYSWSATGGTFDGSTSSSTTTWRSPASATDGQTFTITANITDTATQETCSDSATATIRVPGPELHHVKITPPLIDGLTVGETQGFSAQAYDADDSPITSGVTYSWSVEGGIGNHSPATGQTTTFTATTAGTGAVKVTATLGSASVSKSAPVGVYNPLSCAVSLKTFDIAPGGTKPLTVTASGGSNSKSMAWAKSGGDFVGATNTANVDWKAPATATNGQTFTITATATDAILIRNATCSDAATATVRITAAPTLNINLLMQGRPAYPADSRGSSGTVDIFARRPGETAKLWEIDDKTVTAGGATGALTLQGLSVGTAYDFLLKGYIHLTVKKNLTLASENTLNFGTILVGDLNSTRDNQVNSLDNDIVLTGWRETWNNPRACPNNYADCKLADFNLDSKVNSIDHDYIFSNWGKNGDR